MSTSETYNTSESKKRDSVAEILRNGGTIHGVIDHAPGIKKEDRVPCTITMSKSFSAPREYEDENKDEDESETIESETTESDNDDNENEITSTSTSTLVKRSMAASIIMTEQESISAAKIRMGIKYYSLPDSKKRSVDQFLRHTYEQFSSIALDRIDEVL
jgi:hypothetical protein